MCCVTEVLLQTGMPDDRQVLFLSLNLHTARGKAVMEQLCVKNVLSERVCVCLDRR